MNSAISVAEARRFSNSYPEQRWDALLSHRLVELLLRRDGPLPSPSEVAICCRFADLELGGGLDVRVNGVCGQVLSNGVEREGHCDGYRSGSG